MNIKLFGCASIRIFLTPANCKRIKITKKKKKNVIKSNLKCDIFSWEIR